MPRGDRRGPDGNGPMTGKRMGYCVGNDRPGYYDDNQNYGRGFRNGNGFARGSGRGFGGGGERGFGFRGRGYTSDITPNVSEKTLLENEIKILKDQLSSLEKQLTESGEE